MKMTAQITFAELPKYENIYYVMSTISDLCGPNNLSTAVRLSIVKIRQRPRCRITIMYFLYIQSLLNNVIAGLIVCVSKHGRGTRQMQ